jgi:hypothetical protein
MPTSARRLLLPAIGLALVAACTASAPSSSPGSPGASPPPSAPPSGATDGAVEHPTGAKDVVLRYEQGGGMMLELNLTQAPIFTLYGDGTVIFRDPAAQMPPDDTGVLVYPPFRTARLSEEQMQSLLAFALNEGGLGVAKERYDNPLLADAGSAFFTISAGGRTKKVEIYGLESSDGAPDQAMRARFLALAERLTKLDNGGEFPTAEYEPHGYRVVLLESQGQPMRSVAWPWPDLTGKDFVAIADEPTLPAFPTRTMTAEEVAALGFDDLRGGAMGIFVKGLDGKLYSLPVRPLLPEEDK